MTGVFVENNVQFRQQNKSALQQVPHLDLVCIDFLMLEPSKGGVENILVITDHFTRYAQAIPTRNQTARTTAKARLDSFYVHYGFPARLYSDKAQNFECKVIRQLCKIGGIKKIRTTPYHPMGNGQVERFNQTLLQMLGTLENSKKSDWKSYVQPLVHAYNATRHDTKGFSPFYLMFGRHPRLAVDAFLGCSAKYFDRYKSDRVCKETQSASGLCLQESHRRSVKAN